MISISLNLITQSFIKNIRPRLLGLLTRIFYSGNRVQIGNNFKTDSIPKLIVDKGSRLIIGEHVEFRRNVEVRVHKESKIIIGDNSRIDRSVRILASNSSNIELGKLTRIGLNSVLNGGDSIKIGDKCLISGFVYLQTSMHGHSKSNMAVQEQGYSHSSIILGDNVWLGTHAVVMPGIEIQKNSIVGSNAVVTKNVMEGDVVAGVPAKSIKN